jgi:hypothetical protein
MLEFRTDTPQSEVDVGSIVDSLLLVVDEVTVCPCITLLDESEPDFNSSSWWRDTVTKAIFAGFQNA